VAIGARPQRETLSLLAGALALDERQREEFEASAARSALPRRLGGDSPVGPWAAAVISNLPIALTSFVGRDKELRRSRRSSATIEW